MQIAGLVFHQHLVGGLKNNPPPTSGIGKRDGSRAAEAVVLQSTEAGYGCGNGAGMDQIGLDPQPDRSQPQVQMGGGDHGISAR